jgi:hypothetical protein
MTEARRTTADGNQGKEPAGANLRRPKNRFTGGIDDDVTWSWLPHDPDFSGAPAPAPPRQKAPG